MESVKFDEDQVLLEVSKKTSTQKQKVSREDAISDLDFGYKQANDPKKETARTSPGSGIGIEEHNQRQQQQQQQPMRFARQRVSMFPQPTPQFAQPYGQQFGRMSTPGYGHAFQNFGPMGGGPLSPNSGMGSFPLRWILEVSV